MTTTHTGGSATLAGVLDRRRRSLGLSVAQVAQRAALPLVTTQRRFRNADGLKHSELVAIAHALGKLPSRLLAEAEAEEAASRVQAGSAA